jgi:hypothetical protein
LSSVDAIELPYQDEEVFKSDFSTDLDVVIKNQNFNFDFSPIEHSNTETSEQIKSASDDDDEELYKRNNFSQILVNNQLQIYPTKFDSSGEDDVTESYDSEISDSETSEATTIKIETLPTPERQISEPGNPQPRNYVAYIPVPINEVSTKL